MISFCSRQSCQTDNEAYKIFILNKQRPHLNHVHSLPSFHFFRVLFILID